MEFLEMMRSFDGIWYYITAFLCIVFIMAIIGFLMERDNKKKEQLGSHIEEEKIISVVPEKTIPKEPEVKQIVENRPIIDFTETTPIKEEQIQIVEPEVLEEVIAPIIPALILDETPRQEVVDNVAISTDSPFVLEINSSDFEQSNLIINGSKEEK